MIWIDLFNEMPVGIVRTWLTTNEPWKAYFTNDRVWEKLKYVVVKWQWDRTMYFWWHQDNTFENVAKFWDKYSDKKVIQKLFWCDDEVMKLYRN